jgi:hypothetical protein
MIHWFAACIEYSITDPITITSIAMRHKPGNSGCFMILVIDIAMFSPSDPFVTLDGVIVPYL